MSDYGIQLRQPQPNDLIGSTITIAALGTAFEASYGWRLLDGDQVLQEGFFQAGSMGVMSTFVHQEDLTGVSHVGPAIFEFAGDDPSDGEAGVPAPTRVPVVVVPGASGYIPYQVTAGDTLSKITRDEAFQGVTVEQIVAANGLKDPNKIQVGQILRIPV